jgi:hypothetical protein
MLRAYAVSPPLLHFFSDRLPCFHTVLLLTFIFAIAATPPLAPDDFVIFAVFRAARCRLLPFFAAPRARAHAAGADFCFVCRFLIFDIFLLSFFFFAEHEASRRFFISLREAEAAMLLLSLRFEFRLCCRWLSASVFMAFSALSRLLCFGRALMLASAPPDMIFVFIISPLSDARRFAACR